MLIQGRTAWGSLVLLEPGERVVVEVIGILPDLPGDVQALVDLKGGLPRERVTRVRSISAGLTAWRWARKVSCAIGTEQEMALTWGLVIIKIGGALRAIGVCGTARGIDGATDQGYAIRIGSCNLAFLNLL